jgi:hypothetical protein
MAARLKTPPTPKMLAVDSGRLGARRRWGRPRILRLDELDPPTRDVIECILTARANAAKVAKAAEEEAA